MSTWRENTASQVPKLPLKLSWFFPVFDSHFVYMPLWITFINTFVIVVITLISPYWSQLLSWGFMVMRTNRGLDHFWGSSQQSYIVLNNGTLNCESVSHNILRISACTLLGPDALSFFIYKTAFSISSFIIGKHNNSTMVTVIVFRQSLWKLVFIQGVS